MGVENQIYRLFKYINLSLEKYWIAIKLGGRRNGPKKNPVNLGGLRALEEGL